MPALRVARGLRYGLMVIADIGASEELPEFDPNDQAVTFFDRTVILLAQHEVDGPVSIELLIDDPTSGGLQFSAFKYGEGAISIPTGRLAVFTESLADASELFIGHGRYSVTIWADRETEPGAITIVMNKVQIPSPAG